jgi:hypothetical protein
MERYILCDEEETLELCEKILNSPKEKNQNIYRVYWQHEPGHSTAISAAGLKEDINMCESLCEITKKENPNRSIDTIVKIEKEDGKCNEELKPIKILNAGNWADGHMRED